MSGRPLVCMFVRNQFRHDARVTREAVTLIEEGFDVVVFAVAIDPADAGESRLGPIRVIRVTLPTVVWRIVWLAERVARRFIRGRSSGAGRSGAAAEDRGSSVSSLRDSPSRPAASSGARERLAALLTPSHRFLQGLRYARLAGERAAALKPVAYHCHDLNSILAGYRARRQHRAPLIYDAHELWPHRSRPDMRRRKTWAIEQADRFFSRRAEAVVTVNDSIAQHMQRRYRIRDVVVVRNVPSLMARSTPPEHGVLEGFPRPRLVYVGGVQIARGLEQIIAAMPMIHDAIFVAVGPGEPGYRAGLERLAVQRGVADRVRFIDWVPPEAVIPTVAQGDIGLCLFQNTCLSYYYTLPNKFFEYVHAGVPLLASDFPEPRRLVRQREFGVLCDPADPAAIAAAVNHLLSRPDDLARMRDNALKAAQDLNWEHERERLVGLYRRLVPVSRD